MRHSARISGCAHCEQNSGPHRESASQFGHAPAAPPPSIQGQPFDRAELGVDLLQPRGAAGEQVDAEVIADGHLVGQPAEVELQLGELAREPVAARQQLILGDRAAAARRRRGRVCLTYSRRRRISRSPSRRSPAPGSSSSAGGGVPSDSTVGGALRVFFCASLGRLGCAPSPRARSLDFVTGSLRGRLGGGVGDLDHRRVGEVRDQAVERGLPPSCLDVAIPE